MSDANRLARLITQLADRTDHMAGRVSTLTGWRRYILAVTSGIGATLAMAPFYLLPLLVLGYCILVVMLGANSLDQSQRPLRRAFLTGWAFGFGYFLSGIYWMGYAFLVRAEEFAWMVPIVIPGFAAFLALFVALPSLVFVLIRQRRAITGWRLALLFAVCMAGFEYLRGHILTGLPWNLTGQAMVGWAGGAQSAALYGVYGLSLVVLFLATLPALTTTNHRLSLGGLAISLAGFVALFGLGTLTLALSPTRYDETITLTIIQPNIRQKDKINPALTTHNFETLLRLSGTSRAGRGQPDPADYMIWPENAVSWLDEQPLVLELIDQQIAPETIILSGSIRRDTDDDGRNRYYNTMAIIEQTNGARTVTGFYDKHHLVPFGEYLPMKGFLNAVGLSQLAPVEDGFTAGTGPRTLAVGPAAFAPLICYESIFPGAIYPPQTRPAWLVTVTNDGWFGDGAGPRQHLDQARLRAIETGLPMARSANTGISALIDGNGRLLARIALYQPGTIDHALPLAKPATLYSRIGDSGFFLMLLAGFLIALWHTLWRTLRHTLWRGQKA